MSFNPNDHLIDLKGKDYLQVMWRLVWFREEKPDWSINTEAKEITPDQAVFCAKIYDEEGKQKSCGWGSETPRDFKDYIEKAESKAVGRALAMLGYGTQFASEMDEGERIVDSPVSRGKTDGESLPGYEREYATKGELKAIQDAAGGDIDLVKRGLAEYGYASSREVKAKDVGKIIEFVQQNARLPWEAGE